MKKLLSFLNRRILQIISFIIIILLNVSTSFTLEMNLFKGSPSDNTDSSCLRWSNWINLGNTIDLIHLPQTYDSLANFGKIAANYEQIDICSVPVSSDCRILVTDVDPNYPDNTYMACPQVKHIYGTEYGWVQMRFLCWDYNCPCLEWSIWYNYDGPRDDGDVEVLGKTISYEEWPCPGGTSVFDVDCRTAHGKPLSETNNKMLKCDLDGFQCLNDLQNENCVCEDFMVRFLCLKSIKKDVISNDWKECGQEECRENINEEPKKSSDEIEIKTTEFVYPSPPETIHGYEKCLYPKQCPELDLLQIGEAFIACKKHNDTSKCSTPVNITKTTTDIDLKPQSDQKPTDKNVRNNYNGYIDNGRQDIDRSTKKLQDDLKETHKFASYKNDAHYGRSFGKHKEEINFTSKGYETEKETIPEKQEYFITQLPKSFLFNTQPPPPNYYSATNRYEQIGPKMVYDQVETENPIAVDITKYQQQEHYTKAIEEPRIFEQMSNEEAKSEIMKKPNIEVVRTEDGEELIVEALPAKAENPVERPRTLQTVKTYGGQRREPIIERRPYHPHRPPFERIPSHYPEFIKRRPPPPTVQFYADRRGIRPYPGYYYHEGNYWPSYEQYYERPQPPRYEPQPYDQRDGVYKRKYRARGWQQNKDSRYRFTGRPIRQGYDSQGAYKHQRYEDVVYVHDRPYLRR